MANKFRLDAKEFSIFMSEGRVWHFSNVTKVWTELKPTGQPPSDWFLVKQRHDQSNLHLQSRVWQTTDDLRIYAQSYEEYLSKFS